MSIICKSVEEEICKRAAFPDVQKFVRATIDPKTKHQLNFPIDYKIHDVFLIEKYAEFAKRYQSFEIRPDDIWICGYPKTGTVWMQNIVRKLTQNLDFDIPLERTFQELFELNSIYDEVEIQQIKKYYKSDLSHLERMNQMPSPRIFKTHLPPFLLPKEIWTKKAKVVYIARNPKDVSVSYHQMMKNGKWRWEIQLEETCQLMIDDELVYSPLPEHVLSFWQLRNWDNVLFLTYEELSANRFAGCKKVSEFLGYNYDDDKLQQLADLVEFNSMKNRIIHPTLNKEKGPDYSHCRKGQVGGYRDEMSQEWIERFDQWISDKFKNTDFDYTQWL